jgi:hypothetical protein
MTDDQKIATELAEWLDHTRRMHEESPARGDPFIKAHIDRLKKWEALVLKTAQGEQK